MKAIGLRLTAELQRHVVPDHRFRTVYEHRSSTGKIVAACTKRVEGITLPWLEIGDQLYLGIPSGTLTAKVIGERPGMPEESRTIYELAASWVGSYRGLICGASGVLQWAVNDEVGTVVESSATDRPVALAAYIAAQRECSPNLFHDPYDPIAVGREESIRARHEEFAVRLGVDAVEAYPAVHREVLRQEIAWWSLSPGKPPMSC